MSAVVGGHDVTVGAQLTPVEYSFMTRSVLGSGYERACAAAGLPPTGTGWGLVHAVYDAGARVTAVTDDVGYLVMLVDACGPGLAGVEIPSAKFPRIRGGWPAEWSLGPRLAEPTRKAPCPCGSMRRYSGCHGRR